MLTYPTQTDLATRYVAARIPAAGPIRSDPADPERAMVAIYQIGPRGGLHLVELVKRASLRAAWRRGVSRARFYQREARLARGVSPAHVARTTDTFRMWFGSERWPGWPAYLAGAFRVVRVGSPAEAFAKEIP